MFCTSMPASTLLSAEGRCRCFSMNAKAAEQVVHHSASFRRPTAGSTSVRGRSFFHPIFQHQPAGICFRLDYRAYANLLQAKLPASQGTALQQQHLVDGGEVAVCYVVNTAEYCADILPQLEDMIK